MKHLRALSRLTWTPALFLLLWAAPAPAEEQVLSVLSSDEQGLELILNWQNTSFPNSEEGLHLQLSSCGLSGEPGEPMLPRFHRMISVPPGMRAVLSYEVLATSSIEGMPLPYPTPKRLGGLEEDPLYREDFIRNEEAFAQRRPLRVELEEPSRLRDLRIQALVVEPMSWDPTSGLRFANEIKISVRFQADTNARGQNLTRVLRPEKLWSPLYSSALINGNQSSEWRRRVPSKTLFGDREAQTEAMLVLKVKDSGLQGVSGADLIAAGLPAGTSLDEIAIFERRFEWDEFEQPDYQEIPVARIFRDAASDGDLDAEDQIVFLGRRLKDQPDSLDPIEWYGRESSYFLALDSNLALDMESRSAWQEEGSWTTPDHFNRRQTQWGEVYNFSLPPQTYYIEPPHDRWEENLYFFNPWNVTGVTLSIPSPGYLEGSEAHFKVKNQGYNRADALRTFDMIFTNNDGSESYLEQMFTQYNYEGLYETDIAPGVLSHGEGSLLVDRVDQALFRSMVQWWDLEYVSRYQAWNDSIFFSNGNSTGDLDFLVEDLTRGYENWILVKSSSELPVVYNLTSQNQEGIAGDYNCRFRDEVTEDASWWLADTEALYSPRIETASSVVALADPGPWDVLVISHENFLGPLEDRYLPYREAQGYRVKLLTDKEVWDSFHGGAREAIGLRNAARFAYQQWGTQAVILVGDSSKDARALGEDSFEDFMPAHSIHEVVDGVNEVVVLDEWFTIFGFNEWPSMIMGRIPASTTDDLEVYFDKVECFEALESYENCEAAGDWRSRGLMISDDDYSYSGLGDPSVPVYSERFFRLGQEEAMERIESAVVNDPDWGLPGSFEAVPFFEEVITVPWYLDNPGASSSEIFEFLRPELWPVFSDTLSQGYLFAMIQSHANRNLLTHEGLQDTGSNTDHGDHEYLENVGMPFIWAVLGCHGNAFANGAEFRRRDCMGEKFLFLDQNRGSVASYASDGYEFLYPNNNLTNDFMEMLFWTSREDDSVGLFPQWILGSVIAATELRYGGYQSSMRYNLLGDPLLHLDGGPPKIRLFLDGVEQSNGDSLLVTAAEDTLDIVAYVTDEAYIKDLAVYDPEVGSYPFTFEALIDTLAHQNSGLSRAYQVETRIPYDFTMKGVVVEATDQSGRVSTFSLPNPKSVKFFIEGSDSLAEGQWVRAEGTIDMRIRVPHDDIGAPRFSLRADGENTGVFATATADPLNHEISFDYEWAPGAHQLEILLDGTAVYGGINLVVDSEVRLLSGLLYPNPFRDMALFRYSLTGHATEGMLKIYTVSGRLVRSLEITDLGEGVEHWLEWDGLDQDGEAIANGTYLFRFVIKNVQGEELVWQDRVVRMR